MKKIITILTLCFVTFGIAQTKKEKALTKVTEDVCECINEKDTANIKREALEMQLGICIAKAYSKNKEILKGTYDISFTDEASMEAFGEEIGLKMVEICPQTLFLIAQDYIGDDSEENAIDKEEINGEVNGITLSGKIIDISENQFNIITFKGDNKRQHKLLWMEYFEGQELLTEFGNIKKKALKVSYINREMYDSKLKDYRTYKVLRKIEVVN
ncbi:hypothetical protein [uncultured Kordia sp.]|uniref:hypothetical protein n=1 Tax=uncultured Kordia sp. TaxID=507699 RepID=UPI00260D278F|nr:hypothetical protein [uncultured Kordia sp.]